MRRAPRQVAELQELVVLAPRVCLAAEDQLAPARPPGGDGRERRPAPGDERLPEVEDDRLPRGQEGEPTARRKHAVRVLEVLRPGEQRRVRVEELERLRPVL